MNFFISIRPIRVCESDEVQLFNEVLLVYPDRTVPLAMETKDHLAHQIMQAVQ